MSTRRILFSDITLRIPNFLKGICLQRYRETCCSPNFLSVSRTLTLHTPPQYIYIYTLFFFQLILFSFRKQKIMLFDRMPFFIQFGQICILGNVKKKVLFFLPFPPFGIQLITTKDQRHKLTLLSNLLTGHGNETHRILKSNFWRK